MMIVRPRYLAVCSLSIFGNSKAVVYRRQNAVPVSQIHLEPDIMSKCIRLIGGRRPGAVREESREV